MRIVRVQTPSRETAFGVLRDETVTFIDGEIFGQWRPSRRSLPLQRLRLLPPVVPPNILCIGRNYRAHAAEGGEEVPKQPLLFIKATSSLNGPADPIVLPRAAPGQVDFEAELAVVIGKPARHVAPEAALQHVFGYLCANDVSARDCQMGDGQWARAKSFETFCPLGPWIETELDPSDLRVQGRLNGAVMQDARTTQMVFGVRELISYLSRGMTLLPGTVLLTGTPAGCGFARTPPVWLASGDVYEVEIEGIGVLRNPVAAEP